MEKERVLDSPMHIQQFRCKQNGLFTCIQQAGFSECFSSDIRAQSYFPSGNERSGNIVDANMSILRRRIKDVRLKQRLERGHRTQKGWNYEPDYLHVVKRKDKRELVKFLDLVAVVGIAFGVTCASGTILLSLISILVQLNP